VKDEAGKVMLESGTVIDKDVLAIIQSNNIQKVSLRSVLTCETEG